MAKKQQSWAELPEPFNQDFRYFLVLVWRQCSCQIRHQCS